MIAWALVFSLPLLVIGVLWAMLRDPPRGSSPAWLGFAYVSVVSMFLAFIAWYKSMALGGVANASQLQLLQPLLTLCWAGLLGEDIPPAMGLTAILVLICAAVARGARQSPSSAGPGPGQRVFETELADGACRRTGRLDGEVVACAGQDLEPRARDRALQKAGALR